VLDVLFLIDQSTVNLRVFDKSSAQPPIKWSRPGGDQITLVDPQSELASGFSIGGCEDISVMSAY